MDKVKRRIKKAADSLTDETGGDKGTDDQVSPSSAPTGAELMGGSQGASDTREGPAALGENRREERRLPGERSE